MKNFRVLCAARDAFFFAPITSLTTAGTALGSYERYSAYGVDYSPISREKHFRRVFRRFAARSLAQAFFMLISFIFSYSEHFFVVFYLFFSP